MPTGVNYKPETPEQMLNAALASGRERNDGRSDVIAAHSAWIRAEHAVSAIHQQNGRLTKDSRKADTTLADAEATRLYREYMCVKYGVSSVFGILG